MVTASFSLLLAHATGRVLSSLVPTAAIGRVQPMMGATSLPFCTSVSST
ncbi:MAG: hypothetical protein K5860_08655 [Bacteroidales bacterium]|nr:hypothetical protein [Bacteroidales bacterium]